LALNRAHGFYGDFLIDNSWCSPKKQQLRHKVSCVPVPQH
jgi:hypothetical protein